jgi:hypothetical protein
MCNRTRVGTTGFQPFLDLDATPNPPDWVFEEGVFAVAFGSGDVQFYPKGTWENQVKIMGLIQNSNLAFASHTDLESEPPNDEGFDNYGNPVTYWDVLYYAMASYHLGKTDVIEGGEVIKRDYFTFGFRYNEIQWFPEYEIIDFGPPTDTYKSSNFGEDIFYRIFESGSVWVNPNPNFVGPIPLPKPGRLITHDNLTQDWSTLPVVNQISLPGNRAAFVYTTTTMPCDGDFEPDGDVDGNDLLTQAGGATGLALEDFAASFGRPDCPMIS